MAEIKKARQLLDNMHMHQDTDRLLEATLGDVFAKDGSKEWNTKLIGEVAQVKGGKRLPKGAQLYQGTTPWPYLRVVDFKNGTIDVSNIRYLSEDVKNQIARYTISKEDVYISIAGTIGLTGTVPDSLDGANLTENAAKIAFKPNWKNKIDKRFLVYLLQSPEGKTQINKRAYAAGQPKLALMRIKTIEIRFPTSLDIQKKLVTYLDKISSETIETKRVLDSKAQLLNQLEQSILEHAFRGEL